MKYYILALAIVLPVFTSAHDGSLHTETWYQFMSLPALITILAISAVVIAISYQHRLGILTSAVSGCVAFAVGVTGIYYSTTQSAPVSTSVVETLQGVHMTVYRTPDCSCCSVYAEELTQTEAVVSVKTIDTQEMRELKEVYGISRAQESCHTTIVGDYVVEGHVPFDAVAKLLEEQPDTAGIALPGMPMGTPGMPGRQTEVYNVQTVEGELFWTAS